MFEVLDLKDVIEIELLEGCYIFFVENDVKDLIMGTPSNLVVGATGNYIAFAPNEEGDYYLIIKKGYDGEFNYIENPEHRERISNAYNKYVSNYRTKISNDIRESEITKEFQKLISCKFGESEIIQITKSLKRKLKKVLKCNKGDKHRMILPSLNSGIPGKAFRAFTAIGFEEEISNYYKQLIIEGELFGQIVHDFLMELISIKDQEFEYPKVEEFYDPNYVFILREKPYYLEFDRNSCVDNEKQEEGYTDLPNENITYLISFESKVFAKLLIKGFSKADISEYLKSVGCKAS